MNTYAKNTSVTARQSQYELERLLTKFGADQFAYFASADRVVIAFRMRGRMIRMPLVLPNSRDDKEFKYTPSGRLRSKAAAAEEYAREVRRRWRELVLVVKAKLVAANAGITTFEDEFLPYTMLPNGSVVADWLQPQVEEAYRTAEMPALMPWSGANEDIGDE